MCPYIAVLYLCAAVFRKPVCHWIVGDPIALLQSGARKGSVPEFFAMLYAMQDRVFTRLGRWLTGGILICNGRELASAYASPRTIKIVSSTVKETEFFPRIDTCQGPVVRILFVGFVRPEKGIEYLLDAVSRLKADVNWELEIVGPCEFPEYKAKLEDLSAALGISEQIRWTGYVPNGARVFEIMRAADLFALPTLSEGTPHVLAEARANGVPCISTTVGGVPSMVADRFDALLVPPKDARALARALERLISDGQLRRNLIRNGLMAARKQTLDRFIATVVKELRANAPAERPAVAQE
jgi:glycosyltransferase involved in cell wall biosynthesis